MRRIVMFNNVSVDMCFAAADGNLNWVVHDEEIDKESADSIPAIDTILFGRKTYEMFAGFWPHVLEAPSSATSFASPARNPHGPGQLSPQQREFAVMLNETPKVVFSRTLKELSWRPSRLVRELDPHAIEAMKREPGKDMVLFGSGSIVSQLTQHGLIDEYQLVVNPRLLGSGKLLFSAVPKDVKLELLEARPFKSGNVMLRYALAGAKK